MDVVHETVSLDEDSSLVNLVDSIGVWPHNHTPREEVFLEFVDMNALLEHLET